MEIINKIIFPIKDIFVFFIPYVIPIPSESMLLEIANKIELNIITPLTTKKEKKVKEKKENVEKKILSIFP